MAKILCKMVYSAPGRILFKMEQAKIILPRLPVASLKILAFQVF